SIVGLEVSIYKKIADNLYLGIGGESQFFNNGRAVDLYPSISYDITPNLSANATVGYTLGEINDISYTGVSSSIGLNYAFNKKYGVGIRYKNYSIDYDTINGDIPDTLTATTISFNQKF
ncbi:MAG: hypothetical protein U9N59_08435, partial [Campylobacterota bacterium]|nr:hypothetical protein [Campylobacterota bacterium]